MINKKALCKNYALNKYNRIKFYYKDFKALFYYFSIKEILFYEILALKFDDKIYLREDHGNVRILKINRKFKSYFITEKEYYNLINSFTPEKFEKFYDNQILL